MALTGYPVEDLALRGSFVDASRQALHDVSPSGSPRRGSASCVVVVGYLDGAPDAVPVAGHAEGRPAERRRDPAPRPGGRRATPSTTCRTTACSTSSATSCRAASLTVARVHGVDVAVAICEDIWQEGGPVAVTREAGAGLLLVINGSPYERNKDDARLDLVRRRAAAAGCALAYVNMVGGQDELVFDGDSLVVGRRRRAAGPGAAVRRPSCSSSTSTCPRPPRPPTDEPSHVEAPDGSATTIERVVLSDRARCRPTSRSTARSRQRVDDEAEVYAALVTALRDYVAQERLPQRAARPVRRHRLVAGRRHRLRRGRRGERPRRLQPERLLERALADRRRGPGRAHRPATSRPCRSRRWSTPTRARCTSTGSPRRTCRRGSAAVIWMGLSNQHGHLVLACGNKSELAVGYSTIYGDAVGGFAPIKDVPKTWVWRLARWRNARRRGPRRDAADPGGVDQQAAVGRAAARASSTPTRCRRTTCSTTSSTTTSSTTAGSSELVAAGFDRELVEKVLQLVDRAEYKRRQYPPGPKISFKAFGRDRRLPITNRWQEHASASLTAVPWHDGRVRGLHQGASRHSHGGRP